MDQIELTRSHHKRCISSSNGPREHLATHGYPPPNIKQRLDGKCSAILKAKPQVKLCLLGVLLHEYHNRYISFDCCYC